MYIYTVQAMPGQKAKFEGDPSIKYQVKRQNTSLKTGQKGRSEIIRTNLDYEAAVAVIKIFNDKEGESQTRKDEAVARDNAL
ncbi:MAG TPA: hypothetical protein VEX70_03830 [Pyrinomonadaceae bacterium]|jgi:hypothetical protein|nr:hypothetical protein [Pyrinomonadaceae bacterium]